MACAFAASQFTQVGNALIIGHYTMNDLASDVLVIGAGLTGAMIAAHLAEQGARVGIVEAQRVGCGATRRAVGLATLDPRPEHLPHTLRGLEQLRHIAARYGVMLQSCDVLHLASTPERERALQRALFDGGANTVLEWTTQADLLPPGFSGGLLVHDSAVVDVDLLLVRLLQGRNITVIQHSEVFRLQQHRGMIYALCMGHTLLARHVVLATNAYVGLLSPYLADSVRAVRGAVWSSRPLHPSPDGLPTPHLHLPIVVDDARLVLAPAQGSRIRGAAWLWHSREQTADPSDELRRFLRKLSLGKPEQTEQWSTGVTTAADDGAPRVGRLEAVDNIFYALGLGAYGLAWSTIAAAQIAALLPS